jgi:hypothetical protein
MKESATQILLRTAQKWHRIRHLDPETRKRLMDLPEEDFKSEFQRLLKQAV